MTTVRPLALPVVRRHPADAWVLADPYPMLGPTRRAFRAMIVALCPPAPGPTFPDLEDRIEIHVRRMLRYMVPVVALGFVAAVHVVDLAPLWRFRAFSRLSNMERERAEEFLTEMGHSRSPFVRMLLLAIRGLVLSTFYDQDEAHAAMGWRPLPFLTERIRLRQRLLDGEAPLPSDHLVPLVEPAKEGVA